MRFSSSWLQSMTILPGQGWSQFFGTAPAEANDHPPLNKWLHGLVLLYLCIGYHGTNLKVSYRRAVDTMRQGRT